VGRHRVKEKSPGSYVVVSYLDDTRRIHRVDDVYSYREAKVQVARLLREELGLWDTTLADITAKGMMLVRKLKD
jgi:hypothetical protein